MPDQPNHWLGKIGSWLVPTSQSHETPAQSVSNTQVLNELIDCFTDSMQRESVGSSMLFNAHFLILLHPTAYEDRQDAFPVIVDEAVNAFNAIIQAHKADYERIAPVASQWFFKFGGGREFGGEAIGPTDIHVVGALTGILLGKAPVESPDQVNVTRRIKLTNQFEKSDVDPSTFRHIDFREPGAFAVKFTFDPLPAESNKVPLGGGNEAVKALQNPAEGLAQISYHIAELNQEGTYIMRDREIVVARQEPDNQHFPNYLLLASAYVSNPHVRIRYNDAIGAFQLASFSRNETRIDEQLIPRSDPTDPQWRALPDQAQILLNSMVTLQFKRNTGDHD